MAREVECLAQVASDLAPSLGSKSDWMRQAYEAVSPQVPKGEDPEPRMAQFLHERCSVLKSRADGQASLSTRVREFRSKQLVSPEVLAVNSRRVQEAGGLTDELKHELGQETYSDQRQAQVARSREKASARERQALASESGTGNSMSAT